MAADESHDDRTRSSVALNAYTTVSRYRIIQKINTDGMGKVCLAEDTELDCKAVLKSLPSPFCRDSDCHAWFKREKRAVAELERKR